MSDQMVSEFELVLSGSKEERQFRAWVADQQGQPLAEHRFEWRTDSVGLAMELGELARAAIAGQPPDNDLHRTFGQRLFETVFDGSVAELWQQRRQAARREALR